MARAKRTARAEARRRYRAAAAEIDESLDEATPSGRSSRRRAASAEREPGQTPARMGFGAAFRAAIHPVNVRADLAALPWLATAHQGALGAGR